MTNDKILKLAIDIAIKNGFKEVSQFVSDTQNWEKAIRDGRFFMVIFSHAFAKAFWLDNYNNQDTIYTNTYFFNEYADTRWKAHLVYMVLEKDPIKYLEKFL